MPCALRSSLSVRLVGRSVGRCVHAFAANVCRGRSKWKLTGESEWKISVVSLGAAASHTIRRIQILLPIWISFYAWVNALPFFSSSSLHFYSIFFFDLSSSSSSYLDFVFISQFLIYIFFLCSIWYVFAVKTVRNIFRSNNAETIDRECRYGIEVNGENER